MLLLVAVVPLLILLWQANAPVSPARIARFERLHRLSAEDRDQVTAYLAHTRRWRSRGAALGYAAGLVATAGPARLVVAAAAMAAGWLAGAVAAEFRYRAVGGGVLPVRLRRAPVVLAAVVAGVTVLMLVLGRPAHRPGAVLAWGLGGLACAAAILAVSRRLAGRAGPVTAVSQAIMSHSAGPIAAVGTALAVACLAGQVAVVRDGYFDTTASAVGFVAALWALGGITIGWCVAHASTRALAATVTGLVLLTAGAVGVGRLRDRPPYPASDLRATATIRLTDEARFDDDARAVGVSGLEPLIDMPGRQFVGRVDYRLPAGAAADGWYHVAVIDKRRNQLAERLTNAEGGAWNGFMSALGRRYSWLSAMSEVAVGDSYLTPGMTVGGAAGSPGPIVFAGNFLDGAGMTLDDLMVVLIFTGPDNQTYWAHRVLG